jgi:hypothetical protein
MVNIALGVWMYVRIFSVFAIFCVDKGLTMNWSPNVGTRFSDSEARSEIRQSEVRGLEIWS